MKKYLMKQLWRIQQSQAIISIIFWSLTLTGIFYPYVHTYIEEIFGFAGFKIGGLIIGLAILFVFVFVVILFIGFLFDMLKFWKEQQIVIVERNPYTTTRIFVKEILNYRHFYVPMLRATNNIEEAEFFEKWIKKALDEDADLKREYEKAEKWIKD